METKSQVVSSYVRYKQVPKQQIDMLLPAVLGGSVLVLVAVLFWQVSLTLIGTGLATYKLHAVRAKRAELRATGLPVTVLNGKTTYV